MERNSLPFVALFRTLLLAAIFALFNVAAALAQPYGLTSRAPIGPYLDHRLPITAPSATTGWSTVVAFPNLTFRDPTFLIPEANSNRLYVGTLWGIVYAFVNDPNTSTRTVFLDVSNRTQVSDSSGLLGMAFHPEFRQAGSPNRGYVYVAYQYSPTPAYGYQPSYNRLSRFTVPDGATAVDPGSELVLIDQYDPEPWHNGGGIFFGGDGFLYLSCGDGGGANDSYGYAQQITTGLFSGVLRIDVNRDPAKSHPIRRQPASPNPSMPSFTGNYYIPNDNPFVEPNGTMLEEFYAIGLRSPHRMTYDRTARKIWVGDVGETSVEEIDVIEKGGNYQWSFREANIQGPKPRPSPLIGVEQPPVYTYPVGDGNNCIIGGYVYRGIEHAAALDGKYIFGDNGSGRIWALTYDAGAATAALLCNMPAGSALSGLSSFGHDNNGELYLCQMGPNGRIHKLARTGGSTGPPAPALLSQTGAFSNLATLTPAAGLVPYDVNSPLWSDGAEKYRWIAVPNDGAPYGTNEAIGFTPSGAWTFPAGTVFVKHFELPVDEANPNVVKRLETRLLVRDANGGVYGLTYKWRADNSDADLLPGSLNENVTIRTASGGTRTQTWSYPSQQACLSCHTSAASHVLGVNTRQLNGDFTYPSTGVTDNQLRTFNRIALLSGAISEADIPAMEKLVPVTDPIASLELRARSYLDANCSHCHRPGGARAFFDARFSTPLSQQQIVDGPVANSLGIEGAHVITPESIERSIMHRRIDTNEGIRMPPLARNVIDTDAVATLEDWILSLRSTAMPPPWTSRDVGFVNYAGAASYNGSAFTVIGSGADISGNVDAFHFMSQPWTGDGEIVARVTAVQNTDTWAKAGVMFRESFDAGSRNAFMAATPGGNVIFQQRTVTNGGSTSVSGFSSLPRWIRLVRSGTTFRGFQSSDGVSWTQAGSATLDLPATIYVGLAVTSHQNNTLCAATFDNVVVNGPGGSPTPPAAPTNLTATAASSSRIDLAWTDNASDEEGFKIERSSGTGGFVQIAAVAANVTSYANTGLGAGTAYTYRVRATRSTGDSAYSNSAAATTTPSGGAAAPGNLVATAISSSRIDLSWTDNSSNEEGFKIERSINGTMFSQIATVAANIVTFSNTGLTAGTTYTYRVRAASSAGDSAFSNSATATTPSDPPPPPPGEWTRVDVGTVGIAGSTSTSGDTITLRGSGADIWSTADGFSFLHRTLTGDGEIVARVSSLTNTHGWAKAGVMMRETLAAGSPNIATLVTASNGVTVQHRANAGASTLSTSGPWGLAAPYWVRLTRTGNTVVGAVSPNGTTWTPVATHTVSMSATLLVGLAVTSHDNSLSATAVFNNVSLTDSTPPPPSPTAPAAPSSLTATAASATRIDLAWADNANNEQTFKIERSLDGTTFAQIATVAAGIANYADTGLTAETTYRYRVRASNTAGDSAFSNTAVATTPPVSPPPPPPDPGWTGLDIGDTALAGSEDTSGNPISLRASGSDIWNAADGFRFLYRALSGDGSIQARVVSLTNTHGWAKAGVMIRETLAANSRHASALLTASNGVVAENRGGAGTSTTSTGGPWGAAAPYWVRLVRTGNTIVASTSANGTAWSSLATYTVTMGANVYIGLAASSHNNAALTTATFDNVTLTGSGSTPTLPAAPTALTASAVSATRIDLTWNDNAGNETGFEIQRATDGETFISVGTTAANVVSFSNTGLAASTLYTYRVRATHASGSSAFSNVASATTPAAPPPGPTWSHVDVGPVGVAGSDDASGNTITVRGSGSDIWDVADSFRFLYRTLTGDITVEAQVTSLTNTHAWAKAGVMIREDLTSGARNTFIALTPNNGLIVQNRPAPGGATTSTPGPWGLTAPHWVRLVRTGNTITASASRDGVRWSTIATHTAAMSATVHVGFAVTSHNNAALNTAVFTDPFIEQ